MTIVAGFRFATGVLICADSEMTHGNELKTRGSKIFPYEFKASGNKAIFAFSGNVFLSKQCIQAIARKLKPVSAHAGLEGMYDALADQVYDFHQKYIFKHPNFPYGTAPTVDLIVAMWSSEEKRLGLYQSSEHAVVEITSAEVMAVTGSGGTFARYVARPLVPHRGMKVTDLITIAVYALKEAKENVPGCGESSELITITQDGEIGQLGWLHSSHVENFADSFQMGVQHLFVETCDLATPEEQVKRRFDQLWTIITATRDHLLEEQRTKGEGLGQLIDRMIKRKTTII